MGASKLRANLSLVVHKSKILVRYEIFWLNIFYVAFVKTNRLKVNWAFFIMYAHFTIFRLAHDFFQLKKLCFLITLLMY